MKIKKTINLFAGGLLVLNFYRINPSIVPVATPTATPIIKPLINPGLLHNLGQILVNVNKRGELKNVKVTAKDSSSITVDADGTSVKVDISSATHFRRKFWGKSSLAEISVGDTVDVIGRWVTEAKTEIKAVLIRDLSIQKRFGVFFGTVKTITDTGFTMTTIHRGDETVTVDSSAKLINRKQETITMSDIQIGHKVRVRGLWDSTGFTITGVTQVKDFSLPPFESPSPTP